MFPHGDTDSLMKKAFLLIAVLLMVSTGPAPAAPAAYAADFSAILSKIQSMGHGSYTEQEWNYTMQQLTSIASRAEKSGDWNTVVESEVIKAMIYSDIRHDYMEALSILQRARDRYGAHRVPAMKKVYVQEAQVYAKLGDEQAVRRVMDEFTASPHFDPESYAYSGGQGRDVPLKMVRPSVTGADSISVTAMNVARQQSRFAAGSLFPDFALNDVHGRMITPHDFRGKVVLVDFWHRDWTPWRRELAHLASVYSRYHDQGFEIIGMCLEPDATDVVQFMSENRMAWPVVTDDTTLARSLGIFGESANFLLDRNGVIIARNLRGSDLVAALRRALGEAP